MLGISIPNRSLLDALGNVLFARQRQRDASGHRIRLQSWHPDAGKRMKTGTCCCDSLTCAECKSLTTTPFDENSYVHLLLQNFDDFSCTCDGLAEEYNPQLNCWFDSVNGYYDLMYQVGYAGLFEIELGTEDDYGDPGILVYEYIESSSAGGLVWDRYLWRLRATLDCITSVPCNGDYLDGPKLTLSWSYNEFHDGSPVGSIPYYQCYTDPYPTLCACCLTTGFPTTPYPVGDYALPDYESNYCYFHFEQCESSSCTGDTWHDYTPSTEAWLIP